MKFKDPERIKNLPSYVYAEMDRLQEEARQRGVDVISLGVGDPDQPTPEFLVDVLCQAARRSENHHYPSYIGKLSFRTAVAKWYERRFGVKLDPVREVVTLIGSKEGLAHMSLAWAGPGDIVLVPDPAFPVYKMSTILAGAEPYPVPLLEEDGYLPDLDAIPADVIQRAKILYLNYPNNPTGAIATPEFFARVARWGADHEVMVAHDLAYSEMVLDPGLEMPSLLAAPGAMDVGVEFHSLSKTMNMTGWRIGMAVGNARILQNLRSVKTNVDSGVFDPVQEAGIEALEPHPEQVRQMCDLYRGRRDRVLAVLKEMEISYFPPKATFYVWANVPAGYDSNRFAQHVLREAGVVVIPGIGYGEQGEGHFRISLTVPDARLDEAMDRLRKLKF